MQTIRLTSPQRILKLILGVLVCKITFSVLLSYVDYMPANFDSDFLRGRERYFSGTYSWAFYTHITSGPCSLVCGMLLVSEQFRLRFSRWHRNLGRIQVACVLFLVAPSGLCMARFTEAGVLAGAGFAALAAATASCAALGWRSAVKRRFAEHRRWMWRCFILLCSAIVLRLMGGVAAVAGIEAAWPLPAGGLDELDATAVGLRASAVSTPSPGIAIASSGADHRASLDKRVVVSRNGDQRSSFGGRHLGAEESNAAVNERRLSSARVRQLGLRPQRQDQLVVRVPRLRPANRVFLAYLDDHQCFPMIIRDL